MIVFIFATIENIFTNKITHKNKKYVLEFIVGTNNSRNNHQQQEAPTPESVSRHKTFHHAWIKRYLFRNKERDRISTF